MPAGLLFWIIMIIALLFWGADIFGGWPQGRWGHGIALWVILALLGWKVFGPILQ